MEPPRKKPRYSSGEDIISRREENNKRLQSAFESIFAKYSHDFTGVGDEVDLATGEIVVNNGHLFSLSDARDDEEDKRENTPDYDSDELDELGAGTTYSAGTSINATARQSIIRRRNALLETTPEQTVAITTPLRKSAGITWFSQLPRTTDIKAAVRKRSCGVSDPPLQRWSFPRDPIALASPTFGREIPESPERELCPSIQDQLLPSTNVDLGHRLPTPPTLEHDPKHTNSSRTNSNKSWPRHHHQASEFIPGDTSGSERESADGSAKLWTSAEKDLLLRLRCTTSLSYREMADYFPSRTMGALKAFWCREFIPRLSGVHSGPWTKEESDLLYYLRNHIRLSGHQVAEIMPGRTYEALEHHWSLIKYLRRDPPSSQYLARIVGSDLVQDSEPGVMAERIRDYFRMRFGRRHAISNSNVTGRARSFRPRTSEPLVIIERRIIRPTKSLENGASDAATAAETEGKDRSRGSLANIPQPIVIDDSEDDQAIGLENHLQDPFVIEDSEDELPDLADIMNSIRLRQPERQVSPEHSQVPMVLIYRRSSQDSSLKTPPDPTASEIPEHVQESPISLDSPSIHALPEAIPVLPSQERLPSLELIESIEGRDFDSRPVHNEEEPHSSNAQSAQDGIEKTWEESEDDEDDLLVFSETTLHWAPTCTAPNTCLHRRKRFINKSSSNARIAQTIPKALPTTFDPSSTTPPGVSPSARPAISSSSLKDQVVSKSTGLVHTKASNPIWTPRQKLKTVSSNSTFPTMKRKTLVPVSWHRIRSKMRVQPSMAMPLKLVRQNEDLSDDELTLPPSNIVTPASRRTGGISNGLVGW